MPDAAEQELLVSNAARRNSADAYCKEAERSVSLCVVKEYIRIRHEGNIL